MSNIKVVIHVRYSKSVLNAPYSGMRYKPNNRNQVNIEHVRSYIREQSWAVESKAYFILQNKASKR